MENLQKPGDEIWFLRRKQPDGRLRMEPHPKHVEKMKGALNLHGVRPRKIPLALGELPCDAETPALNAEQAGIYRTCVGVLLYLSADVLEAQCGFRLLSQKMSVPTEGDTRTLKHLVRYLTQTTRRMLVFDEPKRGVGFAAFGSIRGQRLERLQDYEAKRFSSGHLLLDGNFLSSSSRTQKSISLSTAEAEYNAATSTMVNALFLRNVLKFLMPDQPLHVRLLCDSAAARGVVARSGVGRVKRLDGKMLWWQSKRKETNIQCSASATRFNISDLCSLGTHRCTLEFFRHARRGRCTSWCVRRGGDGRAVASAKHGSEDPAGASGPAWIADLGKADPAAGNCEQLDGV